MIRIKIKLSKVYVGLMNDLIILGDGGSTVEVRCVREQDGEEPG